MVEPDLPLDPSLGFSPRISALGPGEKAQFLRASPLLLGACDHKGQGVRLRPEGGCIPGFWGGGRGSVTPAFSSQRDVSLS